MEQHYEFPTPQPRFLPAGNRELLFGLLAVLLGLFAANMILFGGFRLGCRFAGCVRWCGGLRLQQLPHAQAGGHPKGGGPGQVRHAGPACL